MSIKFHIQAARARIMNIKTGAKLRLCLCLLLLAMGIGVFCAFFEEEQAGNDFRQAADNSIRELEDKDKAAFIENDGNGNQIWGIRAEAGVEMMNPALILATQFIEDAPYIVAREYREGNFAPVFETASGPHLLAPLLKQDGANSPRLFAAQPRGYAEVLDMTGRPLRWRLPDNLRDGYSLFRPARPEEPMEPEMPLPKAPPILKGGDYRRLAESFAKRFNLNPNLVMAIIHSESNFTPTLVSSKSAMGLMQLLPSTASNEVHRFLYGQRGNVSYAELSVPETNIQYGTAYLHILHKRYFAEIQNSDVRESCIVAAYNMGPNRFIRLYGSNPSQAAQTINAMTPEEFFEDLPNRLPARETRFFVNKVRKWKLHYSGMPEAAADGSN